MLRLSSCTRCEKTKRLEQRPLALHLLLSIYLGMLGVVLGLGEGQIGVHVLHHAPFLLSKLNSGSSCYHAQNNTAFTNVLC